MPPVGKLGITFQNLIGSGARPNDVIALRFEATDSKHYEIDIHSGCVGLLITALSRHLEEIDPKRVQSILINSVQGASGPNGEPMMVLGMEGGGKLPLQMKRADIGQLIELLQNIAGPPEGSRH
jgi:hypothetical protein